MALIVETLPFGYLIASRGACTWKLYPSYCLFYSLRHFIITHSTQSRTPMRRENLCVDLWMRIHRKPTTT